jgi:hypothetical protein
VSKIAICTPAYDGGVKVEYLMGMVNLFSRQQELGLKLEPHFIKNESLIQRARNNITDAFLKGTCDYLMFIDADIGFKAEYIKELVNQRKQVIGGIYPTKSIDYAKIMPDTTLPTHSAGKQFAVTLFTGKLKFNPKQPISVMHIGTGFMLIERSAFEQILLKNPPMAYLGLNPFSDVPSRIYPFFDCGTTFSTSKTEPIYISEDYYFCDLARSAGIEIFAAPWMHFTHTGSFAYDSCFLCSKGIHLHDVGMLQNKKEKEGDKDA